MTEDTSTHTKKKRDLREHILYRMSLYSTIAERNGKVYFTKRFGLSLREYRILGVVSYMQPVSVMALSDECYLDKGQVSRVVSKLEAAGYVERNADADPSARGGKLALTATGSDLVEQGLAYSDDLHARAMSVLSPEERAAFSNSLDRLLGRIREIHSEVHD